MSNSKDTNKKRKAEREALREELLETQFELRTLERGSVLVLISGNDFAGKAEVIHSFYEWLDNRYLNTRAFGLPKGVDKRMPRMWRYWRMLPPKGEMGIYVGAWYSTPLTSRVLGNASVAEFEQELDRIKRFESMLASEGALILKFWLHLDKDEQKKRLRKLARNARTSWRVEKSRWGGSKRYREVKVAAEHMMRVTGTDSAPWLTVNAANRYYRGLTIATTVRNAINARLARVASATASASICSKASLPARRARSGSSRTPVRSS